MEYINKLIQIAQFVNREEVATDLDLIKKRLNSNNKDIVIPLVGEFSSGKTSIINNLTDNKKLETASKPVTATIFEIYFGKEKSYAEIVDKENTTIVDKIEDIKNESVSDKDLIRIFDTSTKVPSSTILVDTPGLSSNDMKHKIALTSYLPKSDAIFLVIDINQQITKTLVDFIETTKLSQKAVYLIVNKCDTKTPSEIENVKSYIAKEIDLPIQNMVCISTVKNEMNELYQLLEEIQKNKNEIINRALTQRVESIKELLLEYIKELIDLSSSNNNLEDIIEEQEYNLKKIYSNIENLIKDADNEIDDSGNKYTKIFEKHITDKIYNIITHQGRDVDESVNNAIQETSQITLSNFARDIKSNIVKLAKERQSRIDAVPLQVLESINIEDKASFNHVYNLNLSELGHKYDTYIGYTVLAAAAAATIYYLGGYFIALGGKKVIKEGSKYLFVESDGSKKELNDDEINQLKKEMIQKKLVDIKDKYHDISSDQKNRDFIGNLVGSLTDRFIGKPQRKKAIEEFLEEKTIPEFKSQMHDLKDFIVNDIRDLLQKEAKNATQHMEDKLKELFEQKEKESEIYNQKIKTYREYINFLKMNNNG